MAYAPPFTYSHVTGIKSPTGAEAEGWLISVGGRRTSCSRTARSSPTPSCWPRPRWPQKLGAQVMGLGAFTKVVGDAGVTVAKQAPLPVTTGNSYSASADALGGPRGAAAARARRGRRRRCDARQDHGRRCHGGDRVGVRPPARARQRRGMARLAGVARSCWRSRRTSSGTNPRAQIHIAATPGRHLAEMDLIVTATSGAGQAGPRHHGRQTWLRHHRRGAAVGPLGRGCRPASRRPCRRVRRDRASRRLHMRNVGLPKGVAYACLAETVVLASRDVMRRSPSVAKSSGRRSRRSTGSASSMA